MNFQRHTRLGGKSVSDFVKIYFVVDTRFEILWFSKFTRGFKKERMFKSGTINISRGNWIAIQISVFKKTGSAAIH